MKLVKFHTPAKVESRSWLSGRRRSYQVLYRSRNGVGVSSRNGEVEGSNPSGRDSKLEERVERIDLVHIQKDIMYKCRPERRKRDAILPKWYCFKCNRYVLPDRKHKPLFEE